MHVGVPSSPPTYRSLLFLWLVEFDRTLLHMHLVGWGEVDPNMHTTVFLTGLCDISYLMHGELRKARDQLIDILLIQSRNSAY